MISARQKLIRNHVPLTLMLALLAVLLVAGGASRADVAGQIVVRFAAWVTLAAYFLVGIRSELASFRILVALLGASILLVAAQLVPLPPGAWLAMPGRSVLAGAAEVIGAPQPWRPWSMSPGATSNALHSLIVPVVVLLLATAFTLTDHLRLRTALIVLTAVSAFFALLQASGGNFANPLVNTIPDSISAFFANRNHLALFLAMGCLLAPSWGMPGTGTARRWGIPLAALATLFFALMIVATGSRMGLVLMIVSVPLGLAISTHSIRREFLRLSGRMRALLLAASSGAIIALAAATFLLGRAASVNRALDSADIENLRLETLPQIARMAGHYLPWGAGAGTFDPVYRITEKPDNLHFQYMNHAHNDWLEIVLDLGIFGVALLAAMVAVWLVYSVRSWRAADDRGTRLARAGSGMLALIFIASLADYPARTPLIMACGIIGAVWLVRSAPEENDKARVS